EAARLARQLETLNARRQELDQRILDEAIEMAERTIRPEDRALVLAADEWHPGVIGIVASRLVERFGRPTFLIGGEAGGGLGRGGQPGAGVRGAWSAGGRLAARRRQPPALHARRRLGDPPGDRIPVGRSGPGRLAAPAARRGVSSGAGRVAGARVPAGAHRGAGTGGGGWLIQIIAGEFKNRRLKTPAGTKTRPTGNRVREAWFSILQRSVRGARVLDLYAGSGSLGLEAL